MIAARKSDRDTEQLINMMTNSRAEYRILGRKRAGHVLIEFARPTAERAMYFI